MGTDAVYRKKTSAHKMKSYLADFEKPFLNAGLIHAPSNIDSDDNSETDEDVSVEDVKDYIDSLFDLAPSTEEVLHIHEQPDSSIQPRVEVISSPQVQPSQPSPAPAVAVYHRLILEKFPGIPEALAGNFASVNWIRRQRVQGFIQQAPNEESKQIQHRTAPSNTFKDSGMGTSIFTFETAQNEVSGIPLPVNYARSERSMTSFGTTHSTYSGKVKLPKPPTKLRPGVVFECSICYSTLSGVDTKMLWKYVFPSDL